MQLWQKQQMDNVHGDLQQVPVVVWKSVEDQTAKNIRRWRLIVEHMNQLIWLYTYDENLTREGTHFVQFYQDKSAQRRRCVRKPKGAS